MLNDFKKFVMRGNVMDLAVGVIIGAAFVKIVSSFVGDILMPPLGMLLGKVDLTNLFISLNGQDYPSLKAAKEAAAPTLNYGLFLNNVIDFVLVAFAVFMLIRAISRFQRPVAAAAANTRDCKFCMMPVPLAASKCGHCTSAI